METKAQQKDAVKACVNDPTVLSVWRPALRAGEKAHRCFITRQNPAPRLPNALLLCHQNWFLVKLRAVRCNKKAQILSNRSRKASFRKRGIIWRRIREASEAQLNLTIRAWQNDDVHNHCVARGLSALCFLRSGSLLEFP
jgi:hypothetical protein